MSDRAFRPAKSEKQSLTPQHPDTPSGNVRKQPIPTTHPDRWYTWALRRRVFSALSCILIAALLAHIALKNARGQGLDTLFMESTLHWSERLNTLTTLVTSLVSWPVIILVGTLVAVFALIRRRHTLAGRALAVIFGANATTQLVKYLLERPDLHITTAIPNSLPSGHTTVAISFALAATSWVIGTCGAVLHEVDALCVNRL